MEITDWMPWVITVLAMSGNWLVGDKSRNGHVIAVVVTLFGITYNVETEQYGFIPANVFGIAISVRNYMKWKAEEKKVEEHAGSEN